MSFKSPKYCLQYLYFAFLTIIAVHFIMESGLSYVNDNYCYRVYLVTSGNLTNQYSDLYNPVQSQCQVLTDQWKENNSDDACMIKNLNTLNKINRITDKFI